MSSFFEASNKRQPKVYAIEDSVTVPSNLLRRLGVSGNRGRIIALCEQLSVSLPTDAGNVLGIVDKDYFGLLQIVYTFPFLMFTEFSCMDCYAVGEDTLKKFASLYLQVAISEDRFNEIFGIVEELFLLRAAKIAIGPTPWPDTFTRLCSIEAGQIVFDADTFVDRLINASGGALTKGIFDAQVTKLRSSLLPDVRHQINGHDLVQLLSWYAHKIGVELVVSNTKPLQRALITSVDLSELVKFKLFADLLTWAN